MASDVSGGGAGAAYFFYGTLCHAPLLEAVLGRKVSVTLARLEGFAVYWAKDAGYPVILRENGAVAQGVVAFDVTADEAARLDFYEGGFGYAVEALTVTSETGKMQALVYLPGREIATGAAWNLAAWQARWGDVVTAAAADVMAQMRLRPAADVMARYAQILVRAASRLRARQTAPVTLRRSAVSGDVARLAWRQPYANFFALEETDLRFRRFDGTLSDTVNRAVFVSGDAATVLPYDPVRDRVLLIEQFRAGAHGRGDGQPWQLEAIAGRVDPVETPEQAARREAGEEAGLTLGALLPIASYYPSPGAKTEYIYSYLGIADLPDRLAGGISGVADEHEDIRTHLIGFDRLMDLVATGEAENGPLLISAFFLARNRDRLRKSGSDRAP